jgi:hypothetical protein
MMRSDYGVLMFSMEMNHRAVFQRICRIHAHVDLATFREAQQAGGDSREVRFGLAQAMSEIVGHKLLVSTKTAVTPE